MKSGTSSAAAVSLTDTKKQEMRDAAYPLGPSIGPDTSLTFDEMIAKFPATRRDGYVFGSGASGTDGARDSLNRLIIKSRATLGQYWDPRGAGGGPTPAVPFSGFEFNPGGGWDLAATSFDDQPAPAGSPLLGAPNSQVFAFEADCLRLQQVLQYGSHRTYLVGNVTAPGINVNVAGGGTTTPIAAFGRVSADIADVNVGDIVSLYDKLVFATAKNQAAGTLTVEGLLGFWSGALEVVSDTWRNVQFHRFAAVRTTAPTAFVNGASGPFSCETPIPPQIVPGCVVAVSPGPGGDMLLLGHTRIKSIDRSGAKHTFTLERPIANAPYATVPYVVMAPAVWTPQMGSRDMQGPINCAVWAAEYEVTLPEVEPGVVAPVYTGAEVNASIASQPLGVKQDGAWYAIWNNDTAMPSQAFLANGKVRTRRSEKDKPFELFPGRGQNGNCWTGNTHARGVYRDADGNITWDHMMQAGDSQEFARALVDGPTTGTVAAVEASISAALSTAFSFAGQAARDTAVAALTTAIMAGLNAYGGPKLANAGHRIHAKEEIRNFFSAVRTRVMNADCTGWRIPGSHWVDPAFGDPSYAGDVSGGIQVLPGTHRLLLPASHRIMAGTKVKVQVVWTKQWSITYIRGEPIDLDWWDLKDQEAPYTMIFDVLGHAIKGWAWGNGFFNRDTAHIADHWMKVHAINIWRA